MKQEAATAAISSAVDFTTTAGSKPPPWRAHHDTLGRQQRRCYLFERLEITVTNKYRVGKSVLNTHHSSGLSMKRPADTILLATGLVYVYSAAIAWVLAQWYLP